ncbi:unnamed protein product [Soboliphyme baturini]|uniref:Cytosolic Fe-S cluster assembly factor NUBP1 homolog n=1 Tax=Soboliphyme baturini TaxID=241478 RepID=A0A183IJJ7_9BILA|nr:unnamed protein product [Soboliphyme baturini]
MTDVPVDAPAHCPGVESDSAGKASACEGCPNQRLCVSGVSKVDVDLPAIASRLKSIRHVVLVLSGKGGVGKSTLACLIARAFSFADERFNVALLDIDICGPSQPTIFGIEDAQVHQSLSGWSPVYVDDNLAVMSVGFLLSSPDDAVIWRGQKKTALIKQFLKDVDWGDLDFMVVDTPPGTSDEHLTVVQCLSKAAGSFGAVIVTTPQEVALLDVRKEVNFCRKVKVPIIGVVENMSSLCCPKCHKFSILFPPTSGGVEKMCREMDLPFLGSLPLDPLLTRCCDEGRNFLQEPGCGQTSVALKNIADKIVNHFGQ